MPIPQITPNQAFAALQNDPKSILVDVRTQAEWNFTGIPDLASCAKQAVLIEWSTYPHGARNPEFLEQLVEAGALQDTPIYLLCRTGGRSQAAAEMLAAQGYSACHNIAGGFEGHPDSARHRNTIEGWRAEGLPWLQN